MVSSGHANYLFFPGAKLETLKIFKTSNSFEDCCLVMNRTDCKLVS